MTEQKTETRILINMKVNDLFKEFDNTKTRFFAEPNNKVLSDNALGEIWVTAAANALLCSLGMTLNTQKERKDTLARIFADVDGLLDRMFPVKVEEVEASEIN